MNFNQPVTELIKQRFSCRTYQPLILGLEARIKLQDFLATPQTGPLGTVSRFELVAATEEDRRAIQGLGTYGFVKDAPAFIIGATVEMGKSLEDFGYLMETIILLTTDLGLGTCWLGGSFTRSRFAQKISLRNGESIPAVVSLGQIAEIPSKIDALIRSQARGDHRRPWDWMFFAEAFRQPLSKTEAAEFALPLEMVRLGPSASNLQPWRIIRNGSAWHFYLRRKPGYRDSRASRFLRTSDLQRVDMGIAMCHFALTAQQLGLPGHWGILEPEIEIPDSFTEYTISWVI